MMRFLNADAPAFRIEANPLPRLVWLWLPVALFVVILGARVLDEATFLWLLNDELGPGENLTALMFLVAALGSFRIAADRAALGRHWVRWLFGVLGVACVLVAGEEASWGQHFFGWGTPDWVAEVNKQDETNLHNMAEEALDQKPRSVASILILLGGVIAPLLYARGALRFLDRLPPIRWLLPPLILAPSALLVFAPRIVDRIQVWFNVELPEPFFIPTRQFQEMQELSIALFLILYVVNLVCRLVLFHRRRLAGPVA